MGCKKCKNGCRTCNPCIKRQTGNTTDATWSPSWPNSHIPRTFRLADFPPPQDQQDISACAVNACATALNYGMHRQGRRPFRASRLFLYYTTRRHIMRLPRLTDDTGCSLRDVCAAAVKYGVCDEGLWPYHKKLIATEPPAAVVAAAAALPPRACFAVKQRLPDMVSCLVNHHPIMMGMSVYSNITAAQKEGVMGMPGAHDVLLGAHAVLVCGYNIATRMFTLQNCWGEDWGKGGFFDVPMEFVLDTHYCWDLWILAVQ